MPRIGDLLLGSGVVHGAAYAGKPHDAFATTERFLLDPRLQAVEGAWALEGEGYAPLAAMLRASGCDIVYAVGGVMRREGIDPSAADPADRATARDKLMRLVEGASDLGARMLLLCAGPDTGPERRAEAIGHLAETLGALCAHARAIRPRDPMWITFENFDRDLDQKRLLGPTTETVAMIRALRREHFNIGVTLDLSHLVQLGEDVEAAVAEAAEVTIHAHVASCGLDRAIPGTFGDSHCGFDAPGSAVTVEDAARFLAALARTGYGRRPLPTSLPIVSVEMKTPTGETPEIALAHGLRVLYRAAAMADIAVTARAPMPEPVL